MSNKDASVSILLYSREDRISFLNLRAIHKFHDWALEGIEFLMDSLYSRISLSKVDDCMRWRPYSSELLVCVVFDFTMNSWEVLVKGLSCGPWRCFWNNKIPKMVAFCVDYSVG